MSSLLPVWSKPAAFRALRATLVVPSLFALTYKGWHNPQMATFAAFGGFATLVLASFGGTRRNKLVAHTVLGAVGSVLLVIGTVVTSNTALAVVVTLPVVFCVLFAGIASPNAASGGTAALLAYVLPAASPGTVSMIPDRLAGWWLATAAGTLAVLILSPRPPSDRLRAAAADCADGLAGTLTAILSGPGDESLAQAAIDNKHTLMTVFGSSPYRPTGLARPDQALNSLVEALEWSTSLVVDVVREGTDLTTVAAEDRDLLTSCAQGLRDTAALLRGQSAHFDLERFDEQRAAAGSRVADLARNPACQAGDVHVSFHARIVASAVRSAITNAMVVVTGPEGSRVAGVRSAVQAAERVAGGHASVRSAWFLNSVRGAVALAAAVGVADVVHAQHGFWVVLGALSVLRTNAASTGSTALRAILGTAAGFFIGAALILAIGDQQAALWAALPAAVLVAAYAPGTAPFAVGQAAFTVTVSVLYNILVPVGWRVGVLRIEDVAIGAAVSVAVGVLFWPRGAGAIVADDLADSFHQGGIYLVQATAWAVGSRTAAPDAEARTSAAALRLDDALRGYLAEQGTKKMPKEYVWRLVGGTLRLRLTAQSLASLPPPETVDDPDRYALLQEATQLAGTCDGFAGELSRSSATAAQELAAAMGPDPSLTAMPAGYVLWIRHHLDHMKDHLGDLVDPIAMVAARRAVPWWR
jgi:uncharacterized membrane protein YccC